MAIKALGSSGYFVASKKLIGTVESKGKRYDCLLGTCKIYSFNKAQEDIDQSITAKVTQVAKNIIEGTQVHFYLELDTEGNDGYILFTPVNSEKSQEGKKIEAVMHIPSLEFKQISLRFPD
jgi:hypothetical protein